MKTYIRINSSAIGCKDILCWPLAALVLLSANKQGNGHSPNDPNESNWDARSRLCKVSFSFFLFLKLWPRVMLYLRPPLESTVPFSAFSRHGLEEFSSRILLCTAGWSSQAAAEPPTPSPPLRMSHSGHVPGFLQFDATWIFDQGCSYGFLQRAGRWDRRSSHRCGGTGSPPIIQHLLGHYDSTTCTSLRLYLRPMEMARKGWERGKALFKGRNGIR